MYTKIIRTCNYQTEISVRTASPNVFRFSQNIFSFTLDFWIVLRQNGSFLKSRSEYLESEIESLVVVFVAVAVAVAVVVVVVSLDVAAAAKTMGATFFWDGGK